MTIQWLDDAGAGPAVLLLHAGIADRRMWRDHLGRLAPLEAPAAFRRLLEEFLAWLAPDGAPG